MTFSRVLLPHPLGAQEDQHLPGVQVQAHVLHHQGTAVSGGDILKLNHEIRPPSLPQEQPDEEGPARQGEDDAHRDLIGGEQHPGEEIAQGEQGRASQGAGGQQGAAVLPHGAAHDVGDDETHKAQQPGEADGGPRQGGGQGQQHQPQGLHRQP